MNIFYQQAADFLALEPDFDVDAEVIHDTACILDLTPHIDAKMLGLNMWASASSMGYYPATMSSAYQLSFNRIWGVYPFMKAVEAEFKRIFTTGKDPNAIAVEGIRLAMAGSASSLAQSTLRRALSVGGEDFDYRKQCHFFLGRLARESGHFDEALRQYELSEDSMRPRVFLEVGEVHASMNNRELAQQNFYMAGLGRHPDAWRRLADLELGISMEEPDEARRDEHSMRALEWQKLHEYWKTTRQAPVRNSAVST